MSDPFSADRSGEGYTWIDHLNETLGPPFSGNTGYSTQSPFGMNFVQAQNGQSQPANPGNQGTGNGQEQPPKTTSDSLPGQFYDGFTARPKDGPDPYKGMTPAERLGRQSGEWVPTWDSGRDAYDRSKEILRKRWNNEPISEEEFNRQRDAVDGVLWDLVPFPAAKGGRAAYKWVRRYFGK